MATREETIDRLVRSFDAMPTWVKTATKHALAAPKINPATGKEFESFREVLEAAHQDTLDSLLEEFEFNGDLLD